MCSRGLLSLDQEVGTSDAVLLDNLTEEAFLANLAQRFKRDQIYTYVGTMVVSVNPYKKLALYTPEILDAYINGCVLDLPPHIYAVAEIAYQSLRHKNHDQCVLLAGESGSGKTEAAHLIMQYVMAVSGSSEEVSRTKTQILNASTVLEAFGNAKTRRNDNSSRFGKFIDIDFDFKGDPLGGIVTNYHLEKSRVTTRTQGERNFHIFYQLLSGAEISLLKSLKLQRNTENYSLLRNRCTQADSMDDKQNFTFTKKSLEAVGLSSDEVHCILQIVASVLKLGNVEFLPHANMDGTEGCLIINEYEVEDICDLFNCELPLLQSVLTQRLMETRHESVISDLNSIEATVTRELLCRALYGRLFAWLLDRINENIKVKKYGRRRSFGILDMYGFEVFERNNFEQLIINYCDEKLQQTFIAQTIKEEQEEYIREGIEWSTIEYNSNFEVCDLIEKNNNGILAILDEECQRPGHVSDETFLRKLDHLCMGHPNFECSDGQNSAHAEADSVPTNCFTLRHFAGRVTYSVDGIVDKNNDLVPRDISHTLFKCGNPLLKILFPEGNPRRTGLKRPATAATQLKISINALLKNLQLKTHHYVRCIKPNELKLPRIFETALVQHQVKYLSLLESALVQRAGYAFHQTYEQFLMRYKMLSLNTWPAWRGLPVEGVTNLLRDLPVPAAEYAFGRAKIFIKSPAMMYELEEFRRLRLEELACLIQKTYRGWRQRRVFLKMIQSQMVIAAHWKGFKERKLYLWLKHLQKMADVAIRVFEEENNDPDASLEPIPKFDHVDGPKNLAKQKRYRWYGSSIQTPSSSSYSDSNIQTRAIYQELKLNQRMMWAASVIQRVYRNWKKKRYLLDLAKNLPMQSPTCWEWPLCPIWLYETSTLLRRLYHKWKCHRYRARFDQTSRNRMREKVTASIIFKDKKASYPKSVAQPFRGDYVRLRKNSIWQKLSAASCNDHYIVFAGIVNKVSRRCGKVCVSHPFLGDYVRLRQNVQWKKLVSETNDQYVVFADIINKVTRSGGKCHPILFVVSTNSVLILDQRTMQIKYRVPVVDIQRLSLSPFLDDITVFHVRFSELTKKKGDFIFQTGHVIEIVTKVFLVVQNATGKPPGVTISNEFDAIFNNHVVSVQFKSSGSTEVQPGQMKISRKPNRMEICL